MKIENRQKFLLILTIAVVALYVGDLLVFEPLGKWWKSRSDTIVTLRNQVKEGKFMLLREPSIRRQWGEMSAKTLPNNTSLAEQQVLKSFDNWSQESGATVTGITPQWKIDSTNYMTLNCRVEASGDLGTLSRFVYDIEQNTMAMKLDSVEFSTHDNAGQQLTLGLQLSGLELTTLKK
jgi:Tfp pilus assembly protein PilO